jgi:hypothetical protein
MFSLFYPQNTNMSSWFHKVWETRWGRSRAGRSWKPQFPGWVSTWLCPTLVSLVTLHWVPRRKRRQIWHVMFENTVECFHWVHCMFLSGYFSKLRMWLPSDGNTKSMGPGNSTSTECLLVFSESSGQKVSPKVVWFAQQVFIYPLKTRGLKKRAKAGWVSDSPCWANSGRV